MTYTIRLQLQALWKIKVNQTVNTPCHLFVIRILKIRYLSNFKMCNAIYSILCHRTLKIDPVHLNLFASPIIHLFSFLIHHLHFNSSRLLLHSLLPLTEHFQIPHTIVIIHCLSFLLLAKLHIENCSDIQCSSLISFADNCFKY